jgi:hypothetical protein
MIKVIIALIFLTTSAVAHEWYDYDCCDTRDCYPLDDTAELKELPGGKWQVKWKSPKTGLIIEGVVPARAVRNSQDHELHGCEIPHTTTPRCIYIHRGV